MSKAAFYRRPDDYYLKEGYRKHSSLIVPCRCGAGYPAPTVSTEYSPKGSPGGWSNRGRTYYRLSLCCESCGVCTAPGVDAMQVINEWCAVAGVNPEG